LIFVALLAVRILLAPGTALAQPVDCERYADETMRLFARAATLELTAEATNELWQGDRARQYADCVADPATALDLFRERREALLSASADTELPVPAAPSSSNFGQALKLSGDHVPILVVAGIVMIGIIAVLTRLFGATARIRASAIPTAPDPRDAATAPAPMHSKPLSGYVISGLLGFFIVHAASDFIVQQVGFSFTATAYAAAAVIGAITGALFNAYAASLLGAFTGVIILLSLSGYIIY
jgi:hypothetical protein